MGERMAKAKLLIAGMLASAATAAATINLELPPGDYMLVPVEPYTVVTIQSQPIDPPVLDTDGDGVNDDIDQCPDTPLGDEVDTTGCTVVPPPVDSDGDGVPDDVDQCPAEPAQTDDGCPAVIPPVEPGDLAAALADMQPGEWRAYGEPLSTFVPLRYRTDYGGGNNGAQSILESWNSCAEAGGYFACWGGGHADGGYTGVYAIDLSTGGWVRLGDEYPYDTTENVNGVQAPRPTIAPPPTHTYNGFLGIGDKLYIRGQHRYAKNVAFAGSSTWILGTDSATAVFDVTTQTWSEPHFLEGAIFAAYNPGKGLVYDEAGAYDLATMTKVDSHQLPRYNYAYTKGLRYDKYRDVLWLWQQYASDDLVLYRIDLDTNGFTTTSELVTTHAGGVDGIEGSSGMDFGPDGRMYWWGGKDVIDIYDPDADTWEQLPALVLPYNDTMGNPVIGRKKPFGKWQYVESLGVFIGLDAYYQQPRYFKPPVSGQAEAPVQPPSDGLAQKTVVDGVLHYDGVNSGLLDYELRRTDENHKPPDWGFPKGMGAAGEAHHIGLVTEYIAGHIAGDDNILPTVLGQADFDFNWVNPPDGYAPAVSHLAHVYWYPYLLTGDQKYLDKLRQQVDWMVQRRGYIYDVQPRALGWGIVSLAELASVDDSYKPILKLTHQNLPEKRALPNVTHTLHRDTLGFIGPYGEKTLNFEHPEEVTVNIWQEVFILQGLAHTVLLGHDEWMPELERDIAFFQKVFDRNPWLTILYQSLVVWKQGEDLSTLDKVFAYNVPRNTDWQSNASRGRYFRAALKMAVVAGASGARELLDQFEPWFEQRIAESGSAKWWTAYDMNKHAMVLPGESDG